MTGRRELDTERRNVPGALVSRLVLTATVPLPRYVRARYRQEFLAEMYGMSRSARSQLACDLVLHSIALRSAIRASTASPEPATPTLPSASPLRCRLASHRWVMHATPDGTRFRRCARCGKDKYDGSAGPMDGFMAANPFGGGF
jgi:hypothetical protein